MARKISYYVKNGIEYARIPGKSVRIDGKPRKAKGTELELGRVIDREHHVYFSKKRGVYTYNPDTGEFGPSPDVKIKEEPTKKPKVSLDFGGSFFLHELLKTFHCENSDTLLALITHRTLTAGTKSRADIWYESSFAQCLYPRADLSSPEESDLLTRIPSLLIEYVEENQNLYESASEVFQALQAHKCTRYKTRITVEDPPARAEELYRIFQITPPHICTLDKEGRAVWKRTG